MKLTKDTLIEGQIVMRGTEIRVIEASSTELKQQYIKDNNIEPADVVNLKWEDGELIYKDKPTGVTKED